MKLTKYEHACFTVEKNGNIIVVDPGGFTTDFISPEHVVAVIITHVHGDHFNHDQLNAIIDKNPDAIIIAPQQVTEQIEAFETKSVNGGDSVSIGGFDLVFYGGEHATIHASLETDANVGVLIDELLYYPGDSLTNPGVPVDTLALPVSAPWLKTNEAVEFLSAINPRFAFPTHDAIMSKDGKNMLDNMVPNFAIFTGEYKRIDGQTIEI